MKHIWQIPYSDHRERCAVCFKVLFKGQFKYPSKKHKGERFDKVCGKCHEVERLTLKVNEDII